MSLSPEAKALIDAARRDASGPGEAARARMRRKVLGAVGAGAIASAAGSTAAAAGTATKVGFFASLGLPSQIGAGLVAIASVAGGYVALRDPAPSVPPAATVIEASARPVVVMAPVDPIVIPTVAPQPTAPEEAAPAPVVPSSARPLLIPTVEPLSPVAPPARPAPVASDAETLREELALIGAAQSALGRGAPAAALASLDEHAARFPSGALALERRALRALALCAAGRHDEGRAEADAFAARAGGSPLAERVAAACR